MRPLRAFRLPACRNYTLQKTVSSREQCADPAGSSQSTCATSAVQGPNVQTRIERRAATEPIPDLLADMRIYAQECFQLAVSAGPQAASKRLATYIAFLQDSRFRLDELVRSALDEVGVISLQERFATLRQQPARSSLTPLVVNDHVFGWAISA